MKAKFYSVDHANLSKVAVDNGQLIATKDVSGFYYDMGGMRHKLQAADDVLYCLIDSANTSADGFTGALDYTVTSGTLGNGFDMKSCPYEQIEFVFYDGGTNTQFSANIHGLPYGDNGMYTYKWCNKATASMPTDSSQILGGKSVQRETVYATAIIETDSTFKITGKTSIVESVDGDIITMTESDLSNSNRVALLKIVGRR